MLFKKLIQTILLGVAIWLYLLVGKNSTASALSSNPLAAIPEQRQTFLENYDLKSEVDRFLSSIPAGYYTIATIAGLKTQLENPQAVLIDVREPDAIYKV